MWWSLKEYHRPETVNQTLRLLERFGGGATVLAGGTRLIAERNPSTEILLDLSDLNLNYVKILGQRMRIGAMTTLQRLVIDQDVAHVSRSLLSQAAKRAASRAIRNRATLGGMLATTDSLSEIALALLVLDARLTLRVPERIVKSVGEFITEHRTSAMLPGLIIEVTLPFTPLKAGAAMAEVSCTPRDRPIVNAAALLVRKGGVCQLARLALGGVAPVPIRLPELEVNLAGGHLEEATLTQISQEVANFVTPTSNERGSVEYRREMAGVVAVRALRRAWEQAGKE